MTFAASSGAPDVIVVGGGIVGLATAHRLGQSGVRVRVIEKEPAVARHQTGRNSGVIHSGLYYAPGSLKATNCRAGREALIAFCQEHDVPFELCGKVVVATDEAEAERLDALAARGRRNGVGLEPLDAQALAEHEPHCRGIRALFVGDTGIVDYGLVAARLADRIRARGGVVELGTRFRSARETARGVEVMTDGVTLEAGALINCAGLWSDRVARASGMTPPVRIVPFRGDYHELRPAFAHLCRNLIYPVPDPQFPFLGVHFTRRIGGGVECGPSAVLAFAREGYTPTTIAWTELFETLRTPGFSKLAGRHWRTGLTELARTFSTRRFASALRRLVPEVRPEMLRRGHAGVRAQAIGPDGRLVDDFAIEQTARMVHVLNAPSPAATAGLAIGAHIEGLVRPMLR